MKLNSMLSLESVIVVVLRTEGAYHSLFINIYTFIGVPLLTFSCVKNSSIS